MEKLTQKKFINEAIKADFDKNAAIEILLTVLGDNFNKEQLKNAAELVIKDKEELSAFLKLVIGA